MDAALLARIAELEEENARLSARIASESTYQVSVIRNRIKSALHQDVADMEKIKDRPMTLDMGENLRIQCVQIIKKVSRI